MAPPPVTETRNNPSVHGVVPVAVILSGPRRGHRETLTRNVYLIVLKPDESLLFVVPDGEQVQDHHATLHRAGDDYELEVTPDHDVWINGKRVRESRILKSNDLLEIGHGGPVVRYRLYPPGVVPTKTVAEAIVDSFNGAQADGHSRLGKTSMFLMNIIHDLVTETALWFRIWVLILLTVLVISVAILVAQNVRLQRRVAIEDVRIESIEKMIKEHGATTLSQDDLLALQTEVQSQLAESLDRLAELEAGSGKAPRVIARATPSIVFLLGAFGLVEPGTGRYFRYVESGDGVTRYTQEEEGKMVEFTFTGTAFVVSKQGMLLTNRHVVEPWRDDPRLDIAQGRQLTPVILRLMAYFPGVRDPLPVRIVNSSEEMDLALLEGVDETGIDIASLELESRVPQPGDEVLLLGYPTGMRALVARASAEFLESITPDGAADFWIVARRLSEAGYIKPLASRGIVSQVTERFVVYDAETTFGGSGGPVLDLNGRVIAINAALIPEFGGSNMGVPADRIQRFLAQEVPE